LIVKVLPTRLKSLAGRKMIPIASHHQDKGMALNQVKIMLLKPTRVDTQQARAHTPVVRISPTMTTSPKALKKRINQRRQMLRTT
jgi:hypothetical protein